MKLFDGTKTDKRAAALKVMRAAVLIAVAIVAAVVVSRSIWSGHQLTCSVGLWLMGFAFQLSLGLAIGTICYAIISKIVEPWRWEISQPARAGARRRAHQATFRRAMSYA